MIDDKRWISTNNDLPKPGYIVLVACHSKYGPLSRIDYVLAVRSATNEWYGMDGYEITTFYDFMYWKYVEEIDKQDSINWFEKRAEEHASKT